MHLSVQVYRCPSKKDMHLQGGGSQEPGALAGGPGRARGLRQLTEPTLLSSLQDTEIINTAILTGRTVAIPVKVIAIEVTGLVLDVSALVECESDNEDIIKVGFLEVGEGSLPRQVLWVQASVGSLHLQSPSPSLATPL